MPALATAVETLTELEVVLADRIEPPRARVAQALHLTDAALRRSVQREVLERLPAGAQPPGPAGAVGQPRHPHDDTPAGFIDRHPGNLAAVQRDQREDVHLAVV